jgi:hypothetical protein
VELGGILVEELRSSLQAEGERKPAAGARRTSAHDAYLSVLRRAMDRLEFAFRITDETAQRLLGVQLEEPARHGEELTASWRRVRRAAEVGLGVLQVIRVPPEWEDMDREIRQGFKMMAAGVDVLLQAKSVSDTARANRMMNEGGNRIRTALDHQRRQQR